MTMTTKIAIPLIKLPQQLQKSATTTPMMMQPTTATATNSKGCRDSNGNNSSTSNDDGHEGWGELKEVQEVNTS